MKIFQSQRNHRNVTSAHTLFSLAGLCAALAVSANAQTFNWIAGSGSWHTSTNWSPLGIPNSSVHTALLSAPGSYTVTLGSNATAGVLRVLTPTATLAVANSIVFSSAGTIENHGAIIINHPAGGSGTGFTYLANTSLSGSGTLRLNAVAGSPGTAYLTFNGGGEVLTNLAGHTIAGSGRVLVGFDNLGTVNADIAGSTLEFTTFNKSNSGLMTATNGGVLAINAATAQTGTGVIRASGTNSRVELGGVAVTGGLLEGVLGGSVRAVGSAVLNSVSTAGTIEIENAVVVAVTGTVTNTGTITINRTGGGSSTGMSLNANTLFNGPGSIDLNANPANISTAYIIWNGGAEVLTNGPAHTIRGTGRLYAFITNNGMVQADVPGRRLAFTNQAFTNNATARAINGATLEFNTVVNNTGTIVNDGSIVLFNGATLNNGVLNAGTTVGTTAVSGGSTFNSCTVNTPLQIDNSIGLQCSTSLTNNSTIIINPTAGGSSTFLLALSNLSLNGTGTLRLNANPANPTTAYIYWNGGAELITQGPLHSIRGTGRIYTFFANDGVINADSNGNRILLSNQAKTNRNLFTATAGGILEIACAATQTGPNNPRIIANGGSVLLTSADITGGLIQGGIVPITITGSTVLRDLTATGPINLNNAHSIQAYGTIVNNGTITVNDAAGPSGTFMQAMTNPLNLSGTGSLVLKANLNNPATAYLTWFGGSEVINNGANHTIRGNGRVFAFLDNSGVLRADVSGLPILLSTQAKTNRNLMTAQNGGILQVACPVTQIGVNARMIADGGNIELYSASVSGGALGSVGSSRVSVPSGTTSLANVTLSGDLRIDTSASVNIAGTVVNNSDWLVNTTAGGGGTFILMLGSHTVSGNGRIILNANPANLNTAYITYNGGGEVLTNDVGHTIAGTGRVFCRVNNNGIIAPGASADPTGVIEFTGLADLAFGESSSFNCEVEGPAAAQIDRITGSRAVTIDATLNVSLINGYVGNRGDIWTIVSGSTVTGTFATANLPAPQNGIGFRINYFPNRVELETVCYADVNLDGGIDGADVAAFFDLWVAGDALSDLNNDGGVDGQDVEIFFEYWVAGGC